MSKSQLESHVLSQEAVHMHSAESDRQGLLQLGMDGQGGDEGKR